VQGNNLPHRTIVRLLEMVVVVVVVVVVVFLFRVVVVVVLFRVVVDDKLATATRAVEHLAVNSSLPGFVCFVPSCQLHLVASWAGRE